MANITLQKSSKGKYKITGDIYDSMKINIFDEREIFAIIKLWQNGDFANLHGNEQKQCCIGKLNDVEIDKYLNQLPDDNDDDEPNDDDINKCRAITKQGKRCSKNQSGAHGLCSQHNNTRSKGGKVELV